MVLELYGVLIFLIAIVLVTIVYFLLTVKYRHRLFKESEPLTKIRRNSFYVIAMVLLYMIKGSPLDLMGHIMFYAHMIQMAFLYLVIPPILVLAIPDMDLEKIIVNKAAE